MHVIIHALSDYVHTAQIIDKNIDDVTSVMGYYVAGFPGPWSNPDGSWTPPPAAPGPTPAPTPTPTPGGIIGDNGVTLSIAAEYLAALSDALPASALADCFISSDEIASDPDAVQFAAQFIAATAAQLGVDPSAITVNGFSTDNDSTPGCADGFGPGDNSGSTGMTIHVTDAFASALGTDAAFADCWLTAEEINTDPEAAAFVASFVAATAAQLGVDPAAILISGVSTDGDATPGCANGATQQGMTIQVNNGYVASLGNADALADCYLSAEEIASDPEAAALVDEFIIATAAQLGVAPDTISISGLSTDGDQEPGCADGFDPPAAGPPAVTATAVTVNVHPDYAAQLGNADALADCFLTAEEIAADPGAAALAASFIATTAAQLGVEPSMINMNSISLDNDQIPGCAPGFGTNKPSTTSGVTLQISQDFADNLGSDVAFADCWLSEEEIASDPDAAAFAAAFIASTAASLGIEPSAITLSGISTDGDMSPGCGSPGVGNSLNLQIGADFASTFGNDEAFADCWLSAQEIANDPEAAQFAAADTPA